MEIKLELIEEDYNVVLAMVKSKEMMTLFHKLELSNADFESTGMRGYVSINVRIWFSSSIQLINFVAAYEKVRAKLWEER